MRVDTSSETWRTVEKWATGRLEKYRNRLEHDGEDGAGYAALRARIAELKALLNSLPTEEHAA